MMRQRLQEEEYPINEDQAALWRQQTQPPRAPVPESEASGVPNPWIDNLPRRRRKNHGLLIFLVWVLVLLAVIGVYGFFTGLPAEEGGADVSYLDAENFTELPVIDGAEARFEITKERGEEMLPQEIYRTVNPAVVTVVSTHDDDRISVGTGVIFQKNGYFVTNAHVIEGAETCGILLSDGRRYEASLVGFDQKRDVAVLRADDAQDLPVAEIGDSELLEVGETVYAIGNPLGVELRGTFTNGIVSAINRDVQINGRTMTLIQTNTAINEGNSGGPLINSFGQVVGLNTIKMSAAEGETSVEGLGFAIPSSTVEYLTNQILTYGEPLPETALGIIVTPALDRAALEVYQVVEGSCAEKAGVREGDLILKADGKPTPTAAELLAVRRGHVPGDEMLLTILRGSEELELTVVLEEAK